MSMQHIRRLAVRGSWCRRGLSTSSSSEVAKAAPVAAKKGGFSQSLKWFAVGAGLSLGLGYLQLSQDIDASTKSIELALAELRRDTLESQKALRQRIAQLEGR